LVKRKLSQSRRTREEGVRHVPPPSERRTVKKGS